MRVEYSKAFTKALKKLSGKTLELVKEAILEAKEANGIEDLTDCKSIETYNNVYRKKISYLRAFFTMQLTIKENTITFEYLVPRGQAYDKKIMKALRKKDN